MSCKSLDVAGDNNWSALVTTTTESESGGNVTVSSTTFVAVEDGVTFKLMVHVSNDVFTVQDPTLCSTCITGSGGCQNETTLDCEAYAAANEFGTPSCRDSALILCTQDVFLSADQVKFSMSVSGWEFANSTNKLAYGLEIKTKTQGQDEGKKAKEKKVKEEKKEKSDDEDEDDKDKKEKGDLEELDFEGGTILYPTTGIVTGGGSGDVVVDVLVTYDGSNLKKQELNFLFDSFATGTELYYDPTLTESNSSEVGNKLSDDLTLTGGANKLAVGVGGILAIAVALLA
jgi:hypothetical protein